MTKRLLLSYLTITVIVLVLLEVPLAVFYSQRERERIAAAVEHDAGVLATLYEDDLEAGRSLDQRPAEEYQVRTGARVVVVDVSGISELDSEGTVDRDFSTRPEMELALTGTTASGTRGSETLGTDLLYVAVPVASGGTVHGALRVTLDTGDVDDRIHRFWLALVAVALVVIAAVAAVGWAIARSVTRPLRKLNSTAARFAGGDLTVTDDFVEGPSEVRALSETMATMARRLDELLANQRSFVAHASHQLRTPLTALRLRLENLQRELPEEPSAELDAAIDETGRLAILVSSLLRLAHADEDPTTGVADLAQLAIDRVRYGEADPLLRPGRQRRAHGASTQASGY
jgi:signal transduction histidine kinase